MVFYKNSSDVASQLEYEFMRHISNGVQINVDRSYIEFTDSSGGTLKIAIDEMDEGNDTEDDFIIFGKWIDIYSKAKFELEFFSTSYEENFSVWDGSAPDTRGYVIYDTEIDYYDVSGLLDWLSDDNVTDDFPWIENFFKL